MTGPIGNMVNSAAIGSSSAAARISARLTSLEQRMDAAKPTSTSQSDTVSLSSEALEKANAARTKLNDELESFRTSNIENQSATSTLAQYNQDYSSGVLRLLG